MVINVDKPFQLLITDDNSAFRQVLRDALELASTNVEVVEQSHETASHRGPILEVFEAESGEEAVEIVRKQRIDIVLLDMHMHIMSGLETLRVLKRMDALRPCILITSDTSEQIRREAQEANAFSVLKKPVPRRQLVATVSTALASAYHNETE
ncbi:MAG: response regulator [Planctomycetaceae bacterium]|nr:response regulator [Planctomycetaceae bacterium]